MPFQMKNPFFWGGT